MINPLLYKKRSLCVFEPTLGGLGATYTVHLRLVGKLLPDFLLVIIELFSVGDMAEMLQANIDSKLAFFKGEGQFAPNFR